MRPPSLVLLVLVPWSLAAEPCRKRDSWPTDSWPSRATEVAAARATEIAALEEYLFKLEGEDAERRGRRTDSVLVVQGGQLVYERYARGFKKGQRHMGWSMSKSVTSALTGAAVAAGKLSIEDSICKHRTDLPQAACAIQVVHRLEFASGIDWQEIYEDQSNQQSSVLAMLYGQGRGDMALFTASHRLRDPPGTSFQYSTGETTLLASVVGKAAVGEFGEDWPWKLLFDRVGMRRTTFERDAAGTFAGGSFVYASPEDWARFGYLFLSDGCWGDARILPEGWVRASTQVSEPIKLKQVEGDAGWTQGRQWWINAQVDSVPNPRVPWPDAPPETFCAVGHWGQFTCIVPPLDLVLVRLGDDRESGALSMNTMLKLAIAVGRAP